ncbi:hypothetical protein VI817_001816 [Penicillium citrinum]|nr:hypothetical protein VI817_001816 [Penicillium citrinum]
MPALGEDIHEWLDEVSITEPNPEVACEESLQELENATGEQCVVQMTRSDLGVCEDSLDPIINTTTRAFGKELRPIKTSRKRKRLLSPMESRRESKIEEFADAKFLQNLDTSGQRFQ